MMSKRRRKDNLYKLNPNNTDDHDQPEDYTADCETYDFINDGKQEKLDINSQIIKSSNYQDSYEALKTDFSQLLNEGEEQNSEYICRDFVRNICRRGRKCKFKHPTSIKRSWVAKTDTANPSGQFEVNFCHDYQNHGCNRPQCRFIHCNRPEQEFYYATGILLSSVICNNIQVPYCKDYLNNACSRIKCKFLHLSKEEIEQQSKNQESINNHSLDYANYTHQSSLDQNMLQSNANFYPNYHDHFSSSQQMNVMPSQTISLGNSLPLTNAQFTVSLPLGSVSYSTSQQQLIAQPSLTNVQYIHDPILSSVAHEVGSIQSDVLNQLPVSIPGASNQHNIVSQIHQPAPQLVYSSIIHNPGVSLPQHHQIQPQFTLISSDNQNHSQLLSAPLPGPSSNASAHIINPVAVAHANPSQNQQQYTISQQPPVGMSIFSVATPCSLLSAPPTSAEVMHSIQHQQIRSFDQNDQACIVQKSIQPNPNNIDLSINDNSHLNSTLTPIYIQHNLASTVPVTQYRVTALETTTTPGVVIHNTLDPNNIQLLQQQTTSSDLPTKKSASKSHNDHSKQVAGSSPSRTDSYHFVVKENEKLKRKLLDLQKQTSDLQTANELLLDQNARLRTFKTCCNAVSSSGTTDSKSVPSNNHRESDDRQQSQSQTLSQQQQQQQSLAANISQKLPAESSVSEMATITLTVPIGIPHNSNPSTEHHGSQSNSLEQLPSAEISYLLSTSSSTGSVDHHENSTTVYTSVCTTAPCSDYISPTLVSSALRSIQKSVMPTLHALVASSNAAAIKTEEYSLKSQQQHQSSVKQEFSSTVPQTTESTDMEIPMRSSSCPVTCSYKSVPEQAIKCHESTPASTSSNQTKVCCLRLSSFNQTPQLCFQ